MKVMFRATGLVAQGSYMRLWLELLVDYPCSSMFPGPLGEILKREATTNIYTWASFMPRPVT